MFELSQQHLRETTCAVSEMDNLHSFTSSVAQVLDELQIPNNEMSRLGEFLEGELNPELDLIHHQEQDCLNHYRNWKADHKNLDKRALFIVSLCRLLEMRPRLQHLSSQFADLQEDLGY
jgi:hypothetical protein